MSGFNEKHIFFDDATVDNPFRDASVQEIITNTKNQFHKNNLNTINKNEFNINTEDLIRKEKELEKKERILSEREKELRNSSKNMKRSNWPLLPEKCCLQPCFYQDIEVEIPSEFQKIVYNLYYLWIFHAVLLSLNTIGGIILHDFNIIGEGLLYLLLFTPMGYVCWFRPAYKAFRSDSSFNFMIFFFIFFFQLIISTIHAVGVSGCGTVGILTAIIIINDTNVGIISKILVVIIAAGLVLVAVTDLYLINKIHRIYRNTGASFEKAQQEFASDFLQNQK